MPPRAAPRLSRRAHQRPRRPGVRHRAARRRRAVGRGPLRSDRGRADRLRLHADHRGRGQGPLRRAHHDARRRVPGPRVDVRRLRASSSTRARRSPTRSGCARTRCSAACGARSRTPEDVPVLRAALADAGPDEPRTKMLELRLRTRENDFRTIQGQATLRFLNGRAIAVEITGRDVTRMRAAEDRGDQLSTQLEALVASAPDGIIMADAEGRIVLINEQACTLMELAIDAERADGPGPGVARPRDAPAARRPGARDRAPARGGRARTSPSASSTSSATTGAASASTSSRCPTAGACGRSATPPTSSSSRKSSAASSRR